MEPPYEVDEDSARIREVYARFGLAIHNAQVLETGLIQFVITLQSKKLGLKTTADFDSAWDKLAQKTFGQLLRVIDPQLLDKELNAKLQEALALRNKLAHKYFWEKAVNFLDKKQQERMVEELQGYADFFNEIDEVVTNRVFRWAEQRGIPLTSYVEEEIAKLKNGAENPLQR